MIIRNRFWKTVHAEEENALIKIDGGLPQKYSEEDFALTTKTGDWLPRLQLMTANSEKVTSSQFPMNHYAIINGQNFTDQGANVDVLIIGWRPKAIEMADEVISVFDIHHPEFIRIQEKSSEPNSGCMYGPEFLVWVPNAKTFATFFMGSKSARREAPGVKARMYKAATLKSHLVKTAKYSWQVPNCTPCTTPFSLPDEEEMKEQVEKFNNPPQTTIERVTEEDKTAATRAR